LSAQLSGYAKQIIWYVNCCNILNLYGLIKTNYATRNITNKKPGEQLMRPLDGIKVIEMAGLAPGPYCGMILADFGAEVVIIDRLTGNGIMPSNGFKNPADRGKRSIRTNLKTSEGCDLIKKMIPEYDILIDPFRPGVMEALGLGPEEALKLNPGLIYARLTGWGQEGQYASMAGHDINYIGLSGALSLFRRKGERPLPPCNALGDFAGGGMLCAMGILLALIERSKSGKGQVIDSAMVDGSANIITFLYGMVGNGLMSLDIGTNELDSGAPYYQTYETSDGQFMTVGALEPKFYAEFIKTLGLDQDKLPDRYDKSNWPELMEKFSKIFKTKTRDEWEALFVGKDACVGPVLNLDEVAAHPHNKNRNLLMDIDGIIQPAPAPRLSRTPGQALRPGTPRGSETLDVLKELGYSETEIQSLFDKNIVQ
jgi:alpha-methylacyl-CoA racemase